MGQIRGARGSRPFKLLNEIMSLTKVGIYALGVTKIHQPLCRSQVVPVKGVFSLFFVILPLKTRNSQVFKLNSHFFEYFRYHLSKHFHIVYQFPWCNGQHISLPCMSLVVRTLSFAILILFFLIFWANSNFLGQFQFFSMAPFLSRHTFPPWHKNQEVL